MDAAEPEAHELTSQIRIARAVDGDVISVPVLQRYNRARGDGPLVDADRVEANAVQVVDRRPEADDLADRRRAGFELPRKLVGRETVEANVGDHVAAAQKWGHGL